MVVDVSIELRVHFVCFSPCGIRHPQQVSTVLVLAAERLSLTQRERPSKEELFVSVRGDAIEGGAGVSCSGSQRK